jgi:hypothetical protein
MPIVAVERGGEVHVFLSVEEAESYIEPTDVEHGEYDIFDRSGAVLAATIEKASTLLAPKTVRLADSGESDSAALEKHLRGYIARLKQEPAEGASLDQLVEQLVALAKY